MNSLCEVHFSDTATMDVFNFRFLYKSNEWVFNYDLGRFHKLKFQING